MNILLSVIFLIWFSKAVIERNSTVILGLSGFLAIITLFEACSFFDNRNSRRSNFRENYPATLRLESQELRKTLLEKGAISEKEVLREDALEKIALKVYLKERLKKKPKRT